jgi:hypothetical protein
MTNILQKEDSIPVLQGMGVHNLLEAPSILPDYIPRRATPRRKTNLELGEWTTIPQGAATLSNCLQALLELIESEFSTVTAASDPRLKGNEGYFVPVFLTFLFVQTSPVHIWRILLLPMTRWLHTVPILYLLIRMLNVRQINYKNQANAEKLWDITEKMIGETFAF